MTNRKKNVAYNLFLTLSNILFPIITFPYVARIIGPDGIGRVQFVLSFAQYFALIAALGIPIYGIREVARQRENKQALSKLFCELLIINIITTFILLVIYFFTIIFFEKFRIHLDLYYLGALVILFGFSSIDWFYMGNERFKFIAIRSIVIKSIAILALFLLVKKDSDVSWYLSITIFSMIANNLWNLFSLKGEVVLVLKNLDLRKHLPALFTIFSTTVSISIYTILDTILLGLLSSDASVGFYSAAVKLNRICLPIVAAYGVVIMPKIVRVMNERNMPEAEEVLNKSFAYVCMIAVPISFGLFLFAREFIIIFSGEKFLPAAITMQIMSTLPLLIGLNNIFGMQILTAAGHDKKLFVSVTLGMIASFALNIFLIPLFHENGTALATMISEIIVTALTFYFVRKSFTIRFNHKLLINAVLSSLAFLGIIFFLRYLQLNPFLILLFGIMLCAINYTLMQMFVFKNKIIKEVLNDLIFKRNASV